MGGIIHPFTGARYARNDDGTVTVTSKSGKSGLFERSGKWISGELRECDAQVCGWVGGPRVGNHRLSSSTASAAKN